jgi:Predicted P-loop-containing kinase
MVTVLSFGFKYGIPVDSDLVFDVRFLPNPFYIPELKKFSGMDEPVSNYVLAHSETQGFINKLDDMLKFLIPNYVKEGKRQLIISIGCTGGRHRSVAIANAIYEKLKQYGQKVNVEHRDISEDINRGGMKL